MNYSGHPSRSTIKGMWWWALVMLAYAVIVGGYFTLRYGFQWTEVDTSVMTRSIETIRDQATLRSTTGVVYPHGFCYQAVSLVLLSVAGLPIHTLQAVVWPLVAPIALALTTFVFYITTAKDRLTAALAVLLLFFQPDVLFVTLRGAHEKLDWPLMLVALTLLSRSTDLPLRATILHVLLFYLCIFTSSTINVFFASTFLAAVIVSLILGTIIARFGRHRFSTLAEPRRLTYVSLSCAILIFLFTAYIYPPALSNLRTLRTALDQISALLLSFEARGQPYDYISFGWVSTKAYLSLTVFTWLLIVSSFAAWLWRGREILRCQQPLRLQDSLDWLFYAGFAFQVGVSIVVDFAGVLSQNLQLRILPGFTILAVVLLARSIRQIVSSSRFQGRVRYLAVTLAALAAMWFAVASVLKATNEPLLSNKWTFYSRSEDTALYWVDKHLQFAYIWTGIDERMREVFRFRYENQSQSHNFYDAYDVESSDRYILLPEREWIRATRIGISIPPVLDWNRVYDNGDVFLYHRQPLTPYQR